MNAKGLTVVELLVAVILLTVVSVLTLTAFRTGIRSREVSVDRVDIYEKGRAALDLIVSDLRTAFLTAESISSDQKPWDEERPITRFVGINRVFPFGDPDTPDAQDERAERGFPLIGNYPRDLLSFAAVQENPGGVDDIVHIAYTVVCNWEVREGEPIRRMTLVRGYDYKRQNDIDEPKFITPLRGTEDDEDLTWSAVSENIWGINVEFFTYDYSDTIDDGRWTNFEPGNETSYAETHFETPYLSPGWKEGMAEWHSGAESCCFAAWMGDGGQLLQDQFGFTSFDLSAGVGVQQPFFADPMSGSLYPLFLWEPRYGDYYLSETYFLANEIDDEDFGSQGYKLFYEGEAVDFRQADFDTMIRERDGLPQMVQITVWVQAGEEPRLRVYPDGEKRVDDRFLPVMLQTRVHIPITEDRERRKCAGC